MESDQNTFIRANQNGAVCNNINYFLSMRMKQSDWLIRLSQRAVFFHPARCEMQPTRCEMQPARCEIQPNLCEKL